MMRTILAAILILIGLVGCNLTGTPVETVPVSPPRASETTTPTVGEQVTASLTPFDTALLQTSTVQLEGVSYTAWQVPGDPFRFVCQDPCRLDPQFIYAEYAGFRQGHARLIELTGVDTLAELQPVDMHLEIDDSICSELPGGHAYVYADKHQAYTCTEGPGYYPSMEERIQKASRLNEQYFPLHEYMHTIFFGRLSGLVGDFRDYKAEFFHDYIVPVPAYAIGDLDPAVFCTFDSGIPSGDYGGMLILELCQRNGFELPDLAASLVELDRLYQSGEGQVIQAEYEHAAPSVAQYRDILNNLLGSDTTPAFAAACWPPLLFGNSFSILPECVVETGGTPTPLK